MELHNTLQAEFPQIDASLLAAIIADHAQEGDDTARTSNQVENIRDILKVLANQAQEDECELDDIMSTTSLTTPDLCDSTTTASESSSSQHSFSSPLGFLQEAFSDVPIERLKRLLREGCGEALEGDGDIDMQRMVEYILNMEHIRDLEERGIDAIERTPSPLLNGDWETVVHAKPRPTPKLATPTKKKVKGRTIKIVDMMQTHHAPPSPTQTKGMPYALLLQPCRRLQPISNTKQIRKTPSRNLIKKKPTRYSPFSTSFRPRPLLPLLMQNNVMFCTQTPALHSLPHRTGQTML